MIEVVLNSDTTANIHKEYGGALGIYIKIFKFLGALNKESIVEFLKKHNPDPK
jgi:hypothetical protein